MNGNYKNKKFQELLDRLQQDSWQLELIISGFAIFGLFTALPEVKLAIEVSKNSKHLFSFIISMVALISCYILIFNLLLHVTLRGLWIGALGLRYISGDIDFKKLNYRPNFKNYLKNKIISFDRYVAVLENYCSILFAASFLLIFYVISVTILIVLFISVATFILSNDNLPEGPRTLIGLILMFIIFIGSIFLFLDFVTQGGLKRNKWLAKIYYPFYRLFSILSLSFLYRPLVYNFLDNRFTKRVSLLLVPIYLVIILLNSVKLQTSNYLDTLKNHSTIYLDNREYADQLTKDNHFVKKASIQSKIITEPYINFFKVFTESVENNIYSYHPSLKPKYDQRGFKTGLRFNNNFKKRISARKKDSLARKYLEVFNAMYTVYIDTLKYKSEFLIAENKKKQTGFETYIPTKQLSEGKHILRLKRKLIKKKDTLLRTDVIIPFWYYKN